MGWDTGDLRGDRLGFEKRAKNKRGAGKTHFVQTVARPSLNALFSNPSLSSLRIPCVPSNSFRLRGPGILILPPSAGEYRLS